MAEEQRSLVRAARSGAAVGTAQFAAYIFSFFLGVAIAAAFGASRVTDAYFMASSTAELLAKIFLGGALTSVFLPILAELEAAGDRERAKRLFAALFALAVAVFLVLAIPLELFSRTLVDLLAPGFDPDTRALTTLLLRIVFPASLLAFLADLTIVPLHVHRRFGLPALSRLLIPLSTLAVLLLLAPRLGVLTLAVGAVAGTAVQVVLLFVALHRSGYRVRLASPFRNPDVRRVIVLTLPFIVSILAAQGAGVVYRVLVSHQPEGSLTSLKFAEKISQMTNVLFLGSITQVAFPAFARAAATTSHEEIRARLTTAVRSAAFFAIPITVGAIVLREHLVRILFERGAFTEAASATTAALVPFYMIGLLGNGVSSLLGHLALALKETRRAVGVNVGLQAIATLLFLVLVPLIGVPGLALVSGAGPFVLTGLYVVALRGRFRGLGRTVATHAADPRLLVAGTAAALLTYIGRGAGAWLEGGRSLADASALVGGTALGCAGYLGTAWLLKVPEVGAVRHVLSSVLRRPRANRTESPRSAP